MRITNGYIKHLSLFRDDTDYLEGWDNNIRGIMRDGKFRLRLNNSFGNKASIIGWTVHVGPLRLTVSRAYGYVGKPKGVMMAGFSWGTRDREYMVIPTRLYRCLYVVLIKEQ